MGKGNKKVVQGRETWWKLRCEETGEGGVRGLTRHLRSNNNLPDCLRMIFERC